MNRYEERLMDAPSMFGNICPFCGKPTQNRHHIVYRSHGGTDGPVIDVCGMGNADGCHGELHAHRLHLDWSDELGGWAYKRTEEPTKDVWIATSPEGWRKLVSYG